ncbi:hypothetical protein [Marilutibacter chinensis]|uniref:Alpha/beta hydrolase family protein n=1 Tax=Marilutibacter chinensis TaxID=2912247 RepID=A0ABS9HX93_9GAMM|nr:hypothetical protein [Lysobacter chinensis]MCF7223491.1 hypothetical protein [Lysobacter chinensis]
MAGMRVAWSCLLALLPLAGCALKPAAESAPPVAETGSGSPRADGCPPHHLIYLHGRIVQESGRHAVSPEFGRYRFDDIVEALGRRGAVVHAEVRAPGTELQAAADAAVAEVRKLKASGVASRNIGVVGASQGAIIALLAADRLADPQLRVVAMGACNDWVRDSLAPRPVGRVLDIHERSDTIAGGCAEVFAASPGVTASRSLELDTGLSHGFLYAPLPEWVEPALDWTAPASCGTAGRYQWSRESLSAGYGSTRLNPNLPE